MMDKHVRDLYLCILSYGDTVKGQGKDDQLYWFLMSWMSWGEEVKFRIWIGE
jgi:hypothetical protein